MTITTIIPALNEAAYIEDTLASVERQPGPKDVIVVDGGSADDTVALAERTATVVESVRGRAQQMNAGAARASGDVLFFLHADTRLPPEAFSSIRAALIDPQCRAGAFRLAFDVDAPLLRFYSFCTAFAVPSICFGDRGLFVRRGDFERIGGFPDIPIFEDLTIVRRLHEGGGFRFLPAFVTTSARRFERRGHLRQQLRNLYLWLHFMAGTDPERVAHLYTYRS